MLAAPDITTNAIRPESPPFEQIPLIEAPKGYLLSFAEYAADVAEKAGIDSTKFQKLVECESLWKADAEGDNGTSFGLLQFKINTFELFKKKYEITNANINNPYDQIDLAAKMIADRYLFHWKNCARKIGWKA